MNRYGFTLIELLFSIAISMIVLGTGFMAFRTAQDAMSVGNRLADENAILRAGYFQMMEEGDFWTESINHWQNGPDDSRKAALERAFAELHHSVLNTIDNRPIEDWLAWSQRGGQYDRVGDPDPDPLPDPDNPGEFLSDGWHGRDFVLGGVDKEDAHQAYYDGIGFLGAMFRNGEPFREYLQDRVGWYAYLSLLPPHTVFAEAGGGTLFNGFGAAVDYIALNATHREVTNKGGGAFLYLDSDNLVPDEGSSAILRIIERGDWGDYSLGRELLMLPDIELPKHWPNLAVSTARYMFNGRTNNEMSAVALSPYSGGLLMLHLNYFGTNFRGARIIAGVDELTEWAY